MKNKKLERRRRIHDNFKGNSYRDVQKLKFLIWHHYDNINFDFLQFNITVPMITACTMQREQEKPQQQEEKQRNNRGNAAHDIQDAHENYLGLMEPNIVDQREIGLWAAGVSIQVKVFFSRCTTNRIEMDTTCCGCWQLLLLLAALDRPGAPSMHRLVHEHR